MVALLCVIFIHRNKTGQVNNAAAINVAGYQRALTQRIAYLTLQVRLNLHPGKGPALQQELTGAMDQYRQGLARLTTGDLAEVFWGQDLSGVAATDRARGHKTLPLVRSMAEFLGLAATSRGQALPGPLSPPGFWQLTLLPAADLAQPPRIGPGLTALQVLPATAPAVRAQLALLDARAHELLGHWDQVVTALQQHAEAQHRLDIYGLWGSLVVFLLVLAIKVAMVLNPTIKLAAATLADLDAAAKAAEEARLREKHSLDFLTKVANNVPALVGYWTVGLECRFANHNMARLLGCDPGDQEVGACLYGTRSLGRLGLDIATLPQHGAYSRECELKDDRGINGNYWVQCIPDRQDGTLVGYLVVANDLTELRQTEWQLKTKLERAMRVAGVAAWTVNFAKGEFWVSDNMSEVLPEGAVTADEAGGFFLEGLSAAVSSDDRGKVQAAIDQIRRGEDVSLEFQTCGDQQGEGELKNRFLLLKCQRTHDYQKRTDLTIGVLADITAQKLDAQRLQRSMAWRRAILDGSEFAIIATDPDGTILTFNRGAERLLGYSAREIEGRATPALFHQPQEVVGRAWELSEELRRTIEPGFEVFVTKARQSGRADTKEWTYVRKDGSHFPVLLSVTAMTDAEGQITGYLGIAQDISQLSEARRQAQLYRETLDQTAIVAFTDHRGVITYANDKFCQISGFNRDEILGRTHAIVNGGYHEPGFFRELWQTIGSGQVWRGEICNVAKDGSEYWVDTTIIPHRVGDGKAQYIAIRFEVTARKQTEKALVAARQEAVAATAAKSQFLANMSHEIRTPMNGVMGMAELLMESDLSAIQESYTRVILDSSEALLAIVNDVLDFSKIEAGMFALDSRAYCLHKMLQKKVAVLRARAQAKDLELACYAMADLPEWLLGDEQRLGQVVLNLMGNAVKFTEIGAVVCWVTRVNQAVRFEVRDTGVGIAADHLPMLFQPFSQVDGSDSRRFGGTGLGLSICRELVHLMGGQIGVTSELGVGSVFWFEIPLVAASGPKKLLARLPKGGLVAMVGDKDLVQLVLGYGESWGLETRFVADIADIMDLVAADEGHQAASPCIILVDQRQAVVQELLKRLEIRRLPRDCHLLITRRPGTLVAAAHEGCRFINKPLVLEELWQAIKHILEGGGSDSQPQRKPASATTPVVDGGRILVAEDNPVNQLVVRRQLEKAGFVVSIVGTGLEAVAAVQQEAFDLILMDCHMPELDGYEATKRIRAEKATSKNPDIPIIALTANALKEDLEKCLNVGMDGYLCKPFKKAKLMEIIQKWLNGDHKRAG